MIRQSTIDKLHLNASAGILRPIRDYPLKTASVCWLIKNGISEKAQNCKSLSAVLNSVIPMRAWKISSIILTEIWIKDRCWNSPPAGIYPMTTISF